jgi:cysteine desulfurase/selenocysteine lyase
LNTADPLRVVFGLNVTEAMNLALHGYLRPGDHIITSSIEHNAVMRPLRQLEREGVEVTVLPCSAEGFLDSATIEPAIRPNTIMIVLNHASNVIGNLLPITEAGRIVRAHNLLLAVDTAQTAGAYPIDMEADGIDLLGFTGHKSLCGPMGTGGLIVGQRVDVDRLTSLKQGGTGSRSEHEEQPDFLPDKGESGTANVVGLAGLAAGVRFVMETGVETIRAHEVALIQRLMDGLQRIPGVTVHGGLNAELQMATTSFNIAGQLPSDVGLRLDEEFGILCRVGLHCSPAVHKTIGTFPTGTVRFALSYFNTKEEVDRAIAAVAAIARSSQ